MADDKEIVIKVTLDNEGAVKGFEDLSGSLKELSDDTQQTDGILKGFSFSTAAIAATVVSAFAGIGEAAKLAFEQIQPGDALNDAKDAFDSLTESATVSSDKLLEAIRLASQGAATDVQLLQAANRAISAGLDPKLFDDVTAAAKRYADAQGIELPQALDTFTTAIIKGNETQLLQLGLLKDGKIQIDAYTSAQAQAAQVNQGVGDTLERLKTELTNAKTAIGAQLDKSEELKVATEALGKVTNAIILTFYQLGAAIIELGGKAIAFTAKKVQEFRTGLSVLGEIAGQISRAELPSVSKAQAKVAEDAAAAAKAQFEAVDATRDLGEAAKITITPMKDLSQTAKEHEEQVKKSQEAQKKFHEEMDKAREAMQKQLEKVRELNSPTGIIDLANKFTQTATAGRDLKLSASEIYEALREQAEQALKAGYSIESVTLAMENSANTAKELTSKKSGPGFFESLLGIDLSKADPAQAVSQLADKLKGAFGQLFNLFKTGFKIDSSNFGQLFEIGGTIGGAIIGGLTGEWAGAAAGASVGTALGSLLGGALESVSGLFGSDNAGTQFRKNVDKFFAEAFDGNRLQVIIENQLKEIQDLEFSGGDFGDPTQGFFDAFNALSGVAQSAFGGIASGFAELLGESQEFAGNLAAVFANNVGGSLNNLQLLVQATGKSFEELRDSVVEAFLDGKLSAIQAQTALNGIAQVAQKGIPDALGAVSDAFQNLKDAGEKGGRASVDALQDIAFEAKELGLKTIPEVIEYLAKTGKFSSDEIKQVFDALHDNGIDTIDSLASATTTQLISALSELQAQKFPFAQAAEDAQGYLDVIDKLPTEKNITINVDARFSSNAQKALDLVGKSNNLGVGVAQQ